MPILAYSATTGAAALLLGGHTDVALYLLAGAVLLLLFTGIHNAWDTAVWIATATGRPPRKKGESK